ncbi:hypothetical protein U8527_16095 [Kordia algicida OT-1]|uniref:Uncharacterized protein n=1 Tax=Kordia algicida OT-1 TaxID=391587 RepID=A9E4B3_9FLAO|nr:hypothetical protein [Kordia algicida]EDP95343.1 hypothetical protein KAOT1_09731 [Kordia algicida OT-1]
MSTAKTGKFTDYSNQISNLIWTFLIGIIITNVYIIQRSLHWNQIVKEKVGISLSDDYSDPDYMTIFWETL